MSGAVFDFHESGTSGAYMESVCGGRDGKMIDKELSLVAARVHRI